MKKDSTTRYMWKFAKVEELLPGEDGKVLSAVVKVASRDKRPAYHLRVIHNPNRSEY